MFGTWLGMRRSPFALALRAAARHARLWVICELRASCTYRPCGLSSGGALSGLELQTRVRGWDGRLLRHGDWPDGY